MKQANREAPTSVEAAEANMRTDTVTRILMSPSEKPTLAQARPWRGALVAVAAALLVVAPALRPATAAPLSLSQSPLFLANPVKNHIMMIVDDSGSMDSEVLLPTNDGAAWWHTGDQRFNGRDRTDTDLGSSDATLNFNSAGGANATWKKYVYLFPNGATGGSSSGHRQYADAGNDHYGIPPFPAFAWARSYEYNRMYFNPAKTYDPFAGYGGTTFGNSSETAARVDPIYPASPSTSSKTIVDLVTTSAANNPASGWCGTDEGFYLQPGMTIPAGTEYCAIGSATWFTAGAGGVTIATEGAYGIKYYPATFYLKDGTALPTGYDYTATPDASARGPDGTTVLKRYEIKSANFGSVSAYNAAIRNFANWFTYYRKRHIATRAGIGHGFAGLGNLRTGVFAINNRVAVTSYDLDVTLERNSFFQSLYNIATSGGGTPNRQALDHAGSQYQRTNTGAPIKWACQQNFAMLLTDGFATVDTSSGVGNVDGQVDGTHTPPWTGVAPYTDSYSDTIADIAMKYYITPLSALTPTNSVPTNSEDPNKQPHMVTFGIGLGLKGDIYNNTVGGIFYDSTAKAIANPPTWVDPTTARHPMQVDDLYHATINSRGDMLNAATADEVRTRIRDALDKIAARTASSSALAVNAQTVSGTTRLYQARFDSKDWSGDVVAYQLNGLGAPTPVSPTAAQKVDAQNWNSGRIIITYANNQALPNCTGGTTVTEGGVPFRWDTAKLSGNQVCALNITPGGSTQDALGSDRLEYLRGNAALEGTAPTQFRKRDYKLGDFIDSAPVFLGAPVVLPNVEPSSPHATFRASKAGRTPMIYVGSNDGMLHGFDSNTLEEKIAYVPSMVFGKLNMLTGQNYSHLYFVDGQIAVGDAYGKFVPPGCGTTACWRSVLVGGLGAGGKGYFALDATDPANFTEANADKLALWEFRYLRDDDGDTVFETDPDLGYSFAKPVIIRVGDDEAGSGNPTWAVIFGNGYNSDYERAYLYVVNAINGKLIRKIMLPDKDLDVTSPSQALPPDDISYGAGVKPRYANGLSSPAVVDSNGDLIADYVFAGDLVGNLWKIDLTGNNKANWGSFYKNGSAPVPLYRAIDGTTRLAITQAPSVGLHPAGLGGFFAFFGSGRYIATSDNNPTTAPVHAFHGVWDRNTAASRSVGGSQKSAVEPARLRQQTITETTTSEGIEVRTLTNKAIDVWTDTGGSCNPLSGTSRCMGWITNLLSSTTANKGEKSITDSVLIGGGVPRVVFTTLVPSSDPCQFGGFGWLMELDQTTGGQLLDAVIDVNFDGAIDNKDKVGTTPVGGVKIGGGIPSAVTLIGLPPGGGGGGGGGGPMPPCPTGMDCWLKPSNNTSGTPTPPTLNSAPGGTLGRQSWRQLK